MGHGEVSRNRIEAKAASGPPSFATAYPMKEEPSFDLGCSLTLGPVILKGVLRQETE